MCHGHPSQGDEISCGKCRDRWPVVRGQWPVLDHPGGASPFRVVVLSGERPSRLAKVVRSRSIPTATTLPAGLYRLYVTGGRARTIVRCPGTKGRVQVGMLRLRSEDRFALLTAALSMTARGDRRLVDPKARADGFREPCFDVPDSVVGLRPPLRSHSGGIPCTRQFAY